MLEIIKGKKEKKASKNSNGFAFEIKLKKRKIIFFLIYKKK